MNGLEEIQGFVKNFICGKEQTQAQIGEIEEKRRQLAQQRNSKKKINENDIEVNELGREISNLGKQSQELQNKLDSNFREVKAQVNLMIDNLVAENIRKIRIINQQIQELEEKNANQKERNARYELQKQEFYLRFGRMPELSERAKKENALQEKEVTKSELEIVQMRSQIAQIEQEIAELVKMKKEMKNGNWNIVSNGATEDDGIEMVEIEEIYVDDFGGIEELYIEEFAPIEELFVEEFNEELLSTVEEIDAMREIQNEAKSIMQEIEIRDEIENMARQIVEEIATETKEYNISKIDESDKKEEPVEDILIFEQEENVPKSKVIIPLFGQKAKISTIVVKIQDGELTYKAQMSDEQIIRLYPSKIGDGGVLLRDKKNREECRDILINYAISEYRVLDKKVISKIDPLVCELLIECAEKYNYNAQELIYNYAMSFSGNEQGEKDLVPNIIYNLSYIEESSLSKKEKSIIKKICRNARKNNRVEVIESFSGFKKAKYLLKRLFAVNNVNLLTDGKYE